ncbi:MAG: type II toxin-antitoxin system RelE/ParE family toxin [Defluviitaleaceae bacterium]|nr:type II toxin-antitoxin system RelE/ParE family toxin [Defluviitaleaceae bacterium]
MRIQYSRDALRFLDRLTKKDVGRIREAVLKLTEKPPVGDIVTLQGYSDGRKRLRVGGWRIIFKYIAESEIEILAVIDIGNRGDIYR